MRRMESLLDANHALTSDISPPIKKQFHWLRAGELLVEAAETGSPRSIQAATDALLAALEREGWMSWQPREK